MPEARQGFPTPDWPPAELAWRGVGGSIHEHLGPPLLTGEQAGVDPISTAPSSHRALSAVCRPRCRSWDPRPAPDGGQAGVLCAVSSIIRKVVSSAHTAGPGSLHSLSYLSGKSQCVVMTFLKVMS